MTTTASLVFKAAHAAAKVADALVAYRTRFTTALRAAWAATKQTIQAAMNPIQPQHIDDIQVTVAENQDYKIYLQGCYNAAGFGDSTVKVLCKNAITQWGQEPVWMSKFGWKESAQFLVMGGQVAPELDKTVIEAFVTQHALAIEVAQKQFIEVYRSESDKAYSQGMTNLMNDNTEDIEDGIAAR